MNSPAATGRIVVTVREGVATVVLDNPSAHNALSSDMWKSLDYVIQDLGRRDDCRVIVIRGAKIGVRNIEVFSSGSVIQEILDGAKQDHVAGGDSKARSLWQLVESANTSIERCPKPVIAMIAAYAYGAACALAAACDIRIAPSHASIGIPAPQIGLTLGVNDTRRLVDLVGSGFAKQLLITGKPVTSIEAYYRGLITIVCSEDEHLESKTYDLAGEISENNAPLAMREAKMNIYTATRNPSLVGIDEFSLPIGWAGSDDVVEGIEAFLSKPRRRPKWLGK